MKQYLKKILITSTYKRSMTFVGLVLLVSVTLTAQTIKLTSTKATIHALIQTIEKQQKKVAYIPQSQN